MGDHDQNDDMPRERGKEWRSAKTEEPRRTGGTSEPWERRALFAFGALFLVALLATIHFVPHPSRQEWFVLLCTLALAAGAIAALLPGSIEWNVHAGLRLTGAVAIAGLVLWLGKSYSPVESADTEPRRVTASMSFERCATAPDDIQRTDVYVALDGKLAWADLRNSDAPPPPAMSALKCSSAQRGQGGITIDCGPVPLGANLTVFVRSIQRQNNEEHWWRTYDLKVPAMYADMDDGSKDDFAYLLQH